MDVQNATGLVRDSQLRDARGRTQFLVACAGCGSERMISPSLWRKRRSDYCKPCGRRVRAGLPPTMDCGTGTRLGNIWDGMRQRCGLIAGAPAGTLANYIERGIRICDEWATSFEAFKAWALAAGYQDDLLLDREDNDLGYGPGNCRWVTMTVSNRNKRNVKLSLEKAREIRRRIASGDFVSIRQLGREYGVSEVLISRIKLGRIWVER